MSSNKVEAVLQDHEGFYWIATQNGLNRFDGTTIKIFRHDSEDSTSLTNNYCTALVEGKNGDIWVATYKGVSRYLRNKGYFQSVYLQHPTLNFEITNRVYDITVDTDGTIWIAGNGLWKYDVKKESITLYQSSITDSTSISDNGRIMHMVYDQVHHGLWLTTGQELNYLNISKNQFYRLAHNPRQWKIFNYDDARELAIDGENRLWFRDKKTQQLSWFEIDQNRISLTKKKITFGIKQIAADDKNRIWIFYWLASSEIYDPETGISDTDFFAPHHRHSMVSEKANSLFRDKENNYWISTGNGISIYNEDKQFYKLHRVIVEDKGKEADPLKIKALAQTEPGNVWLATNLGLYQYNLATDQFKYINLHIPNTNITTLCPDGNILWIGVYDKLIGLNTKTEVIVKTFHLDPGIYFIRKGNENDLWVGHWASGLCRINIRTEEIEYFKEGNEPSSIKFNNLITGFLDGNNFWIGYNAGKGFSRYDLSSHSFTHFHPQEKDTSSSNAGTITVITRDLHKNIWLGTHGSGLFRYDPSSSGYEHYQQEQGLNSNFINSILPDHNGNLWISTADGINFYNSEKQSIRETGIDLIFSGNDFEANGIEGVNGKLYFFCNNEFIEVDPAAYRPDQIFPNLVISSFKVFDKERTIAGQQHQIDLSHRENYFSFAYSAIKTNPTKHIRTAYMLEGFDQGWNLAENQQFAGYTNVPDGNYQFQVKATNEEGQWSESLINIAIHIKPPFWRTWWFALACMIVLLTTMYLIYQNRMNQVKRIYSLRSKISQDLHDDVGASLSSIQIYSTVAEKEMNNNPEKAKEIVQQINQNSRQVMENMSDIVWAMNAGPNERESLAGRIKNYGYELLSQKNIECQYKIDAAAEKKLEKPDARKNVLLVVKEALNNIAKYSEASQTRVQIRLEGSYLMVDISDNGKGFDQDKLQSGNGLHNMKQRTEGLGGKFSISTSIGEGTTIQCQIPLTNISDR